MDGKQSPPKGEQTNIEEATSPLSSSPSHSNPPASMDASFLSPQVKSNTNNQFERSASSGQQEEEGAEPSDTPLLNGENIVLLSFSNDNTPVASNQNSPMKEQVPVLQNVSVRGEQGRAESPPADSVHSGQLTTLSPPPLSQKSSGSAHTASGRAQSGMFSSNGSQGMFSKDVNQNNPPTVTSQGNNPPSIGGRKLRPPLPPRGAFLGMNYQPGVAAVDVLPSHLPPPKQIGNVSHRRVVSTGDVSHISNLTDVDSVADVLEESPPTMDAAAAVGAVGTAASTTAVPTNPSMFGETGRQRGISWDFGAGGRVGEEEPATFEGLGIMQPVLSEEDLGKLAMDDMDLMQPVLDEELQAKPEPTSPPQRKAASEGKVGLAGKVSIGQSGWDKLRANRKAVTQLVGGEKNAVQLSPVAFAKKDGSQFEDEAEKAILAALGIHNLSPTPSSTAKEVNVESSPHTPLTPDDTIGAEVPSFVSSNVQASQHRKNVSSITNLEPIEGSPVPPPNKVPPNIHNLNQKGEFLLFEDQGWHDGYDSLGRTRGSLREEQDAKIVEEAFGELQVPALGEESSQEQAQKPPTHPGKKVSKVSGLMKPLHVIRAKTESAASKKKKDDDYHSSDEEDDELKPSHMRSKTAVSDMAQEIAKYKTGVHNRNKTNMSRDTHGVNNLLDGADLLFRAENKKAAKEPKHEPKEGTGDDEYHENGEGDEEMGEAKPTRKRAHFISATHRSSNRGSHSERKYQLTRWYIELLKPKIPQFLESLKHNILFIYLPLLSLAFILYYLGGNPIAAKFAEAGVTVDSASWSWWLLFIVRQAFVLGCVKTGEMITIDIIALRTPIFVNVFGSFATLMLVQARGWPYVMTFWGVMDFIFLYGSHRFAAHWLFWQNFFEIFTSKNPGGTFIYSVFYTRILITMIVAGFLTALKRLWIATYLGRRSYLHFNPELEKILSKMLLISSVAHLGKQIEEQVVTNKISDGYIFASITQSAKAFPGMTTDSEDDSPARKERKMYQSTNASVAGSVVGEAGGEGFGKTLLEAGVVKHSTRKLEKVKFASSKHLEIMNLLEEWEEPNMHFDSASRTKIKDILQFRQAIALMDDDYCFTPAFGPTSTRAICVDSSEALFNRLVNNDPTVNLLPFETLAEIAYDSSGELIKPKVKALIKLFRPDRNGYMSKIDFLNSIDSVYKSIRLFRASLESSSQVDDNLEGIINVVFYVLLVLVSLLVMGFRVWESLLSITTFFFGFSFMFGPASSNYFEGLLLILLRRPYDVGDKIALSDPSSDTSPSGSSTWFVEQVTLFTTTVRFATTNEVATYSNGSLAQLRIINAKRSPKAVLYVYVKFGSDAPYKKLNIFRSAIENFVKARPREWAQLNGIRTTRVEMELNYVEYVIVVTHREMWQNIGPILSSQADLASFSLEVSKKLDLRYHQPPKPVHLSFDTIDSKESSDLHKPSVGQDDLESVADLFKKDE